MLHVLLGPACNNNCLFCMEDDQRGRARHRRQQSPEDIEALMREYRERDEVLFTSAEPTLSPQLPRLIGYAKAQGYRIIGLITNGRRLVYPAYLAQLLDAGLNRLTISIHGHNAQLHDSLTRTPGSFAQTLAALELVGSIKRGRNVRLHTSTVVNRRNLPHLEAMIGAFAGHGADVSILNVMMPRGRGLRHLSALMPRYHEVVQACRQAYARLGPAPVRVQDVPRCLRALIPVPWQGELEAFEQYEPAGSQGMEDGWPGMAQSALEATGERGHSISNRFYLTDRGRKEARMRVHGPPCERCEDRGQCSGVWIPYVQRFGWQEFEQAKAK